MTLDTSCVSAVANPSPTDDPAEVEAIGALVDLFRVGSVRLQLAAAYERDFDRDRDDDRRRERLDWLATVPPIARAPGVFRLDVSILNGPDVLASDEEVHLDAQLEAILPGGRGRMERAVGDPRGAAKATSDRDHLIAHWRSGAYWFATLDVDTILRFRSKLAELGIVVVRPSEVFAAL